MVGGWLADHLEHVTLQNLKNNTCPVCEVGPKDLNALAVLPQAQLRDQSTYEVKATAMQESDDPAKVDFLISKGIKPPFNIF